MITYKNNVLSFEGKTIEMPIRILDVLEIQNYVVVSLGFSAELDCGYSGKGTWTKEVDDKWRQIHDEFNQPSVYCFDKKGNIIWKFHRYVAGLKIYHQKSYDDNIHNSHILATWIKQNKRFKDEFIILDGEDMYLVELKTGKEVLMKETR
jgi:hypothetical protein